MALIVIAGLFYIQIRRIAPAEGEMGKAEHFVSMGFDSLESLKKFKSTTDSLEREDSSVMQAAIDSYAEDGRMKSMPKGAQLLVLKRKGFAGRFCTAQVLNSAPNQVLKADNPSIFTAELGVVYWFLAGTIARTDGVKSVFRELED